MPRQVTVGGRDGAAIVLGLCHERGKARVRRVPFEHGELGRMGVTGFAVAPDPGQLKDRAGAGCEQALHGEFGGGVQPQRFGLAARREAGRGKSVQVHLLARAGHGIGRLDLGVAARGEEGARRLGQQRAAPQEGQPGGKRVRVPGGLQAGLMFDAAGRGF